VVCRGGGFGHERRWSLSPRHLGGRQVREMQTFPEPRGSGPRARGGATGWYPGPYIEGLTSPEATNDGPSPSWWTGASTAAGAAAERRPLRLAGDTGRGGNTAFPSVKRSLVRIRLHRQAARRRALGGHCRIFREDLWRQTSNPDGLAAQALEPGGAPPERRARPERSG